MWVQPIPLMHDELLSSWLVRASLMMGCDPIVLTNTIWPHWRAWTLDIDRSLSEKNFVLLQKYTGLSTESIYSSLLQPIAEKVSGNAGLPATVWPWILATGYRNRKRRTGAQFCPACIAVQKRPYLSRSMRLAWHTCCEIHGLQLLDQCQVCNSPLEPHRLRAEDLSISICASCHTNLSAQSSIVLSLNALKFQNEADKVILNGGGDFFGIFVPTTDWFQLSDYFITLMRRSAHVHFERLNAIFCKLGVSNDWQGNNNLSLELLSTSERIHLIERVWVLSQNSLSDLQTLINQYNCSQETMSLSQEIEIPDLLRPMMQSLPVNKRNRSRNKITKCHVRSKCTVEKMMARLVRILRMRRR